MHGFINNYKPILSEINRIYLHSTSEGWGQMLIFACLINFTEQIYQYVYVVLIYTGQGTYFYFSPFRLIFLVFVHVLRLDRVYSNGSNRKRHIVVPNQQQHRQRV